MSPDDELKVVGIAAAAGEDIVAICSDGSTYAWRQNEDGGPGWWRCIAPVPGTPAARNYDPDEYQGLL